MQNYTNVKLLGSGVQLVGYNLNLFNLSRRLVLLELLKNVVEYLLDSLKLMHF